MNDRLLQTFVTIRAMLTAPRNEKGATAVEYGLLVTLIALVIIGGVAAFGGWLNTLFDSTGGKIDGAVTP